ncbi:trans-sulfuration enzyme family protein [Enterococcus xiangfangensis]|uniref:trans-sulfuration enzyme family protein n=1 Tax=Enterococcus xiangfangensis TaxID=1296537 RepID=UPI003D166537|nr:aminotransferase class V-fold PLP-dependent enzyme [Enterococcus asini]
MNYNTRLIQGIPVEENPYQAIVPPIFLATTYKQDNFEQPNESGIVYGRGGNPTRNQLEKLVAQLENGVAAQAAASGMAALASVTQLVKPGEIILTQGNIYGGTFDLLEDLKEHGIQVIYHEDLNRLEKSDFTPDVKLVLIESPSNPSLQVTDIQKIAVLAHEQEALVAVDNTFLTSYLQKPLDLGADIVIYSATKYLSGHADVIAGLTVVKDTGLAEKLAHIQHTFGGILAPFDSYSLIRGIKTLSVRFDRQIENTKELIRFIEEKGFTTYFPGSAPEQKEIQARQVKDIGALFSFELPEAYDLQTFLSGLKIFAFAPSLGGVESLIGTPATTSHRSFTPEQRAHFGISDRLIRVAVGIEDIADLRDDLEKALENSRKE